MEISDVSRRLVGKIWVAAKKLENSFIGNRVLET